jgi:hypothetical protein
VNGKCLVCSKSLPNRVIILLGSEKEQKALLKKHIVPRDRKCTPVHDPGIRHFYPTDYAYDYAKYPRKTD